MAKASSDDIKNILAEKFGSAANHWKRLEKKKNAEGEWQRAFEDAASGQRVLVTEGSDGTLSFAHMDDVPATLPVVERDPQKKEAAKKIIKRTIGNDDQEELDDMPELVEAAGDIAYANQFLFAIVCTDTDMKSYDVYIGAQVLFARDGYHDNDSYLQMRHLLPRFMEDESGTNIYTCKQSPDSDEMAAGVMCAPTPLETAEILLKSGFRWTPDFQKACTEAAHDVNVFPDTEIKKLITSPSAKPASKNIQGFRS